MLKRDPEFEAFIQPLSEAEFSGLEKDVVATGGPIEEIVTWEGTVVDGYHRLAICEKHNLPYKTREEHFESRAEAIVWMMKQQLNRRNMTPLARTMLALKAKDALMEVGRQRKSARKDLADYVAEPHNTRKLIAEKAGVSDTFVYQVDYVLQHGEPKLQEAMVSEEMSVGQAYSITRKADEKLERKKQRREEARQATTNPPIKKADHQEDATVTPENSIPKASMASLSITRVN